MPHTQHPLHPPPPQKKLYHTEKSFCQVVLESGRISVLGVQCAFRVQTKVKGKFHHSTGHEGPEGEKMYSSTLPSTSALDGG
jgi:hypothetical protein